MDIIVLVKQVPDTEAAIRLSDDRGSIRSEGLKWVVNPYDEYAVEEALRIREALGGSVTVVSAGPAGSAAAIRSALAMGADQGVLVTDPALEAADSLGVARTLAAVAKGRPFDLILAGQRAVDDDAGLVGPAVAEFLGIPHVSLATKVEVEGDEIVCEAATDGGMARIRSSLPALVTAQKGLNNPRFASMMGIMKAKKKPIEEKTLASLSLSTADVAGKARVAGLSFPPVRPPGRMIQGETAGDKARELARVLVEEAKIF